MIVFNVDACKITKRAPRQGLNPNLVFVKNKIHVSTEFYDRNAEKNP